jgi:hypothetical protein
MRREELEFFCPFESEEAAAEHYAAVPAAYTFEDSVIIARVAPYSLTDAIAAHEAGDDSLLEANYAYRDSLNS